MLILQKTIVSTIIYQNLFHKHKFSFDCHNVLFFECVVLTFCLRRRFTTAIISDKPEFDSRITIYSCEKQ